MFREVTAEDVPQPFRQLLAHDHHMTVTVESFHDCAVNVDVLETNRIQDHYFRKILLRRSTDNAVVQFGIVRLDLSYLSADVISEILSEKTPLGRVLIQHNVMREVQLSELWKCHCGPALQHYLGAQWTSIYGRTAMIYCDGEPVIELFEIATPS
jgi:chorismate-pyruvate lyase